MWFHAIASHGDLLALSQKGPFTLERVGWGTIENIIHLDENSPCPSLDASLRSAVSDTCRSIRHVSQGSNCYHAAAVSFSLTGNSTARHVRQTAKAGQGGSGFQGAQLHNSGAELNAVRRRPHLAVPAAGYPCQRPGCLLLGTAPVSGEGMDG